MLRHQRVPLLGGSLLALLMLGPVLTPGALLNLDLSAVEHWPFPRSFWGLGPELPRLGLLEVPLSVLSSVLSAATAVKVLFFISIAGAFAGAHRLTAHLGGNQLTATAGALLYATSPFFMTRIAVGHLSMVAVYALLPWLVDTLVHPSRSPNSTGRALFVLGLCGFYGGLVGGLLVLCGLATEKERLVAPVALRLAATQLTWLVPGVIILSGGSVLGSAANFPPGVTDVGSAISLFAGGGFWQPTLQVGQGPGPEVVIAALVILGLAVVGTSQEPDRAAGRAALAAACIAIALILCDAIPVLRDGFAEFTSLPGAAALREPQRVLILAMIWLAPRAALGGQKLAHSAATNWRPAVLLAPFALAAVLAAPAIWGVDDRVEPFSVPTAWEQARSAIAADPTTVLVLPWDRYLDIDAADNQRVLNPAIRFFGPDVLVSSSLGRSGDGRETADPRTDHVEALLPKLRDGTVSSGELAALGVGWILILHEVDYQPYLSLLDNPALTSVQVDIDLDLLHVRSSDEASFPATGNRRLAPVGLVGEDVNTWAEPYAWGWIRGTSAATSSRTGLIEVPGGSGPMLFWPALLVLAGYLLAALVALKSPDQTANH